MRANENDQSRRTSFANAVSAFLIGRNHQGQWVVQDQGGIRGGLFVDREAALRYVRAECGYQSSPPVVDSGIFELELGRRRGRYSFTICRQRRAGATGRLKQPADRKPEDRNRQTAGAPLEPLLAVERPQAAQEAVFPVLACPCPSPPWPETVGPSAPG